MSSDAPSAGSRSACAPSPTTSTGPSAIWRRSLPLGHRYRQSIADVEARLERESAELGSTADEQRKTVARLRDELERAAGQAVTEALDELESQTFERRRAIDEITERLRQREHAVAESIERAETDVRARLDVVLVEWERRQTERLARVTEREVERHAQIAMQALDERFREAGRRRPPVFSASSSGRSRSSPARNSPSGSTPADAGP